MAPEEVAYVAGVVDSDGCIRIGRRLAAGHRRAGPGDYIEVVQVRQIEPHALTLARDLFGGQLGHRAPHDHRLGPQPAWTWILEGSAAAEALEVLLPYLRIRRAHAENVLELRRIAAAPGRDAAGRLELLYQRSKLMNATDHLAA